MNFVSLHSAYNKNDVCDSYNEAHAPFSLEASYCMKQNIAFTTPSDMMAYALSKALDVPGRFVPVCLAYVSGRPEGLEGMLRIRGKELQFTFVESGRGDYELLKQKASASEIVQRLNDKVEKADDHVIERSLISMRIDGFRKTLNTLLVAAYRFSNPERFFIPSGAMVLKSELYGDLAAADNAEQTKALLVRALAVHGFKSDVAASTNAELVDILKSHEDFAELAVFVESLLEKQEQLIAARKRYFDSLPDLDDEDVKLNGKPAPLAELNVHRQSIQQAKSPHEIYSITQQVLGDAKLTNLQGMCLNEAAHELIGEQKYVEMGEFLLFAGEQWERLTRACH
jgi:hypothetical protein